jgi:hypothetical protein
MVTNKTQPRFELLFIFHTAIVQSLVDVGGGPFVFVVSGVCGDASETGVTRYRYS